ncbi:MAG TPA: phosphate-starvation-inducible PsiE family protein [Methanospirillum sp.]|nr:phosphate-starvation-inducible PsiE family protein [Methanospirillum sp.]
MNHNVNHSRIGTLLAFLPVALYVVSAAILTVIAAALLFESGNSAFIAIKTESLSHASPEIYSALFHAATAIALLETIEVFFRTHRLVIEVLFLAGIAEVIRYILVYDLPNAGNGGHALIILIVLVLGIIGYQYWVRSSGCVSFSRKNLQRVHKEARQKGGKIQSTFR